MGKYRKKITPSEEGLQNHDEAARKTAEEKKCEVEKARAERRKTLLVARCVFFTAAFLIFTVSAVFAGLNIDRMRTFETEWDCVEGIVTDYKTIPGKRAGIRLIVSYTYRGENFRFVEAKSFGGKINDAIGTKSNIYVNPENPEEAETVRSADRYSVVAAVTFALAAFLFVVSYISTGTGKTYVNRVLCAYLPVFLSGIVFVLLSWIGLPGGGFGEIFTRIRGAAGFTVVAGLVLAAGIADGVLSRKRKKR